MAVAVPAAMCVSVVGCGEDGEPAALDSRSHAIVGGELDRGHEAVAFVYDTSLHGCSAALIDDDVLLTAGHCTAQLSSSTSPLMVWAGTDYFADEPPDWESGVVSLHTHPLYDPGNFTIHDVGIVILDGAAPAKPFRWLDADPGGLYAANTEFTQVGYGSTSAASDGGVKQRATFEMFGVTPELFTFGDAEVTGCFGDSGGPAIVEHAGYVTIAGVLSYVDTECDGQSGNGRTDYNASFLSGFAAADAGTQKAGGGGGGEDGGGLVGCSVGAHGSARGMLVLLGLLLVRRRR